MRIAVRPATVNDIDWLLGQLRAFSEFFDSKKPLFPDAEHARAVLTGMIESHLVLVAEREDGVLLGLIGGHVAKHWMNPAIRSLSECFWWVDEKFRGSRAGLLLFRAFDEWGVQNVDWITMATESKSPLNDKCLTKRGYRLVERAYLKEVS